MTRKELWIYITGGIGLALLQIPDFRTLGIAMILLLTNLWVAFGTKGV